MKMCHPLSKYAFSHHGDDRILNVHMKKIHGFLVHGSTYQVLYCQSEVGGSPRFSCQQAIQWFSGEGIVSAYLTNSGQGINIHHDRLRGRIVVSVHFHTFKSELSSRGCYMSGLLYKSEFKLINGRIGLLSAARSGTHPSMTFSRTTESSYGSSGSTKNQGIGLTINHTEI